MKDSKIIDFFKNIFRVKVFWFTGFLAGWNGSRKLNKWVKKNKKQQDPNLHPFEERVQYHRKKMRGIIKRAGIKVEVEGEENLPRGGGAWIVPNHTSNFDGVILSVAISNKLNLVPIAKEELKTSKLTSGYFNGVDGMFLDRKSPRKALALLEGAAQYAKQKNRAVVIFPEGERSLTGELLEFKNGLFRFPQKYFLPIVPITILGTLEARKVFSLRTRTVKVIINKTIKPINHSKLPTELIGRRIKEQMQKDIDNWTSKLSPKELKRHQKIVEKSKIKMMKRKIRQEKSK
ncbi:MAG: 1-acyl-sn-glycerol-3-phosphate acyltransferase [Candidatus Tyloplasma litorale]|nr:MAG: 1-acyl-sn-glycerol-3-phosphate acyltransferase [Mycoplasmatales bacterium]